MTQAERNSYNRIAETCLDVEAIFSEERGNLNRALDDSVEEVFDSIYKREVEYRLKLRVALDDAEQEIIDLQDEVVTLKARIEALEAYNHSLAADLDDARDVAGK